MNLFYLLMLLVGMSLIRQKYRKQKLSVFLIKGLNILILGLFEGLRFFMGIYKLMYQTSTYLPTFLLNAAPFNH